MLDIQSAIEKLQKINDDLLDIYDHYPLSFVSDLMDNIENGIREFRWYQRSQIK